MARQPDLTPDVAALVDAARQQGEHTEDLRQQMLTAATERARLVHQLHTQHGLSVRHLAALLGVSGGIVQRAVARGGQK